MSILLVAVLAITQGLTEFLPISSSAHLFLIPWIFSIANPGLAFDAALHIGTALALLVFFAKDFWRMFVKRDKLLWFIVIATIPAVVIGFFGDKFIEQYFHNGSAAALIIGIGMVFFSIVLYLIDRSAKLNKSLQDLTPKKSIAIGFAQALALIPGTSRSGVTISAGLLLGLKREDAARFSFLLATPISLGAGLYKALQLTTDGPSGVSNLDLVLGIAIAFVTGIIVIKWLLSYLQKHTLLVFVVYRIIIGLGVIGLWLYR